MADMFSSAEAIDLLRNKNVVFVGGSNMRAMYKDLVWFLQKNQLVPTELLKKKLEDSHMGDMKVRGDTLHQGRGYIEDRSYHHEEGGHSILIEYSFTSSCYSENVMDIFRDIKAGEIQPDVIIMNSTLWDINRWGPNGVDMFKENMVKLMKLVSSNMPPNCIFLWLTASPVLSSIRSSLLPKEIRFLTPYLRFNVLEANNFARQLVGMNGHDVLDLHYYLRMQLFHIVHDGIHFKPIVMRYITNLILTHCSLSWNVPLPGRIKNSSLEKAKRLAFVADDFQKYIDIDSLVKKMEKLAPNKQLASGSKTAAIKHVSSQSQKEKNKTAPVNQSSTQKNVKPNAKSAGAKKQTFSKVNKASVEGSTEEPGSSSTLSAKLAPVKILPTEPAPPKTAPAKPASETATAYEQPVVETNHFLNQHQNEHSILNSGKFHAWRKDKRWSHQRFTPYPNNAYQGNSYRGNPRYQNPRYQNPRYQSSASNHFTNHNSRYQHP